MFWVGLTMLAGSIITLLVVALGWHLVERTLRGRIMTRLLGRAGARLFAGGLGIAIGVLGILLMTGLVELGGG